MVPWWVVFCEVVHHIEFSFVTYEVELSLMDVGTNPIEAHIEWFDSFLRIAAVSMPLAAELWVYMGVLICGFRWPSSMAEMQMGQERCPTI